MQFIIMTSDNYHHCLDPFFYQFDKYFHQWNVDNVDVDIKVCGFSKPKNLDYDIDFYSIGDYADYPADRWSNAFLKVLDEVADETFILMLEDYWLYKPVDVRATKILYDYAKQFQYVLKIDLARDRLYAEPTRHLYGNAIYGNAGYLDLIQSPPGSNYQMSLWGGIWNRDTMKQFIIPNEKAQEIELAGTYRVNAVGDNVLVLGTMQAPLPHCNIYQTGKGSTPTYQYMGWKISDNDLIELRQKGYVE